MFSFKSACRFVVDCVVETVVDTVGLVGFVAVTGYEIVKEVTAEGVASAKDTSIADIEAHLEENSVSQDDRIKDYLIVSYDKIIYSHKKWEISGETTFITPRDGDGCFVFIREGKHQMSDVNFSIHYNVEVHYSSLGQKKMYFDHISVNNIPVDGKVTNKSSAASVLNDISNITKGVVFNDDAVGIRFFSECGAVLLFNEINCNRSLTDYIDMPKATLKSFLINAEENLNIYIDEIVKFSSDESNSNTSSSSQQNFEIYLRVLEFDSVYNVKFDDIKAQYKKLAKKYHPDSGTGDAYRFKLITEAYEYLQESYSN